MSEVLERDLTNNLSLVPRTIRSYAQDWSVELCLAASAYLADHRQSDLLGFLRVDVVLMLLRISSKEALERAQELTGKPITRCPSGVPPWPPKPPARLPQPPKVSYLAPNPCTPSTDMHRRYGLVRLGMTRETMLARGCTDRDIRYWAKNGHVKFTKGAQNGKA